MLEIMRGTPRDISSDQTDLTPVTRSEESFSARGKTGWAWASLLVSPSLSPYTYLVSLALDCAKEGSLITHFGCLLKMIYY